MGVWWKVLSLTIGPFSLGLKTREVRNIVKLRWKLPSNCTKFHPKLCTKNRKSECDFSIVRNFARCFVMRTHTAGKSWFYSRDFRIGNGWSSKLGMRSSSRNFVIFFVGANIASFWSNEDTQCETSRVNFHVAIFCNENGPYEIVIQNHWHLACTYFSSSDDYNWVVSVQVFCVLLCTLTLVLCVLLCTLTLEKTFKVGC